MLTNHYWSGSLLNIGRRFFSLYIRCFIIVLCVFVASNTTDHDPKTIESHTKKEINDEHMNCLATGIYHEANGEPMIGQIAVARVIVNRVLHGFGANPCRVIYQSSVLVTENDIKKTCQFSWVCAGKQPPDDKNPNFIAAKEIARKILAENAWNELIPSNILFFHNITVKPQWSYKEFITIGNHVFYSKSSKL